jgi:hypothetical protein
MIIENHSVENKGGKPLSHTSLLSSKYCPAVSLKRNEAQINFVTIWIKQRLRPIRKLVIWQALSRDLSLLMLRHDIRYPISDGCTVPYHKK